jgi:hypothetical protein
MDWSEKPLDRRVWKRVPGNPFADYDPADRIALWSLWEMPSTSLGTIVRRGRPRQAPTAVRSIRLSVAEWTKLERDAKKAKVSVNALVAERLRKAE